MHVNTCKRYRNKIGVGESSRGRNNVSMCTYAHVCVYMLVCSYVCGCVCGC